MAPNKDIWLTHENGSLGMRCDKVEKFVKGTDAKSANLPQIFQNLHSHTANTNFLEKLRFVVSGDNPKETTPSQEVEP